MRSAAEIQARSLADFACPAECASLRSGFGRAGSRGTAGYSCSGCASPAIISVECFSESATFACGSAVADSPTSPC